MRTLRRFLIRLATSATRRRDEERLREELEEHLALQTAENVRAGLPPVEAKRQALLEFGAVEAIKERCRNEQGLPVLDNLLQDVRYTLRQLQKAPFFTLAATLSLALGIGANAAVFTVTERVPRKPFGRDTYDRERLLVELNTSSDHERIGAESPPPEAMADHCTGRAPGFRRPPVPMWPMAPRSQSSRRR